MLLYAALCILLSLGWAVCAGYVIRQYDERHEAESQSGDSPNEMYDI
jgi:hypothetical protein